MALDRATVVRTALEVLNEVGLDGLTLRRIATELGVKAPALYWHFKNKQELLDEMATTVLADSTAAGLPEGKLSWSEFAMVYGRGMREMLLRYRDGAKMFSGTYLTDNAMFEPMEKSLRQFTTAGFSLADAALGLYTIYCYTIGFTIEEQAVYPRPGERDERYDLDRRAKRIDSEQLPLAAAVGAEVLTGYTERYERGLQVIIRGLRTDPA